MSKILLNLSQILTLLTTATWAWDVKYVSENLVISAAQRTQELLYSVCYECRDQQLDILMKRTQQAVTQPQTILTNRTDIEWRRSDHKRATFTVVLAKTLHDYAFKVMDRVLRGRHFYISLVIVYGSLNDFAEVECWLRFLWQKRFVNADLYYQNRSTGHNEVFGYNYYPVFTVRNKSHLVAGGFNVFYGDALKSMNLHGYKFLTPLMQQAPEVIRISRGNKIKGTAYSVLELFLDYVNGSMEEYVFEDNRNNDITTSFANMSTILDMVRSEQLEITAHAYALFHSDDQIDQSYPLLVVDWCLMVPIENSVSTMYYPLQPFKANTWYALLFTFSIWLLFYYCWLRWCHLCRGNFVLQSFCRFLNISSPTEHFRAITLHQILLNACLYFHGMFLSAMYTSMLGSFLTVNIFHAQINTLADLLNAQIPVMIIDYELDFLLESAQLSEEFLRLLHVTNSTDFYLHQFAFNASYAYFVTDDQWHFLDLQQRYLKQRRFKFTDICFGAYHQSFPMQTDSPIWRELEYFLYRVHSSGFLHHFESKAFAYAIEAGLLQRYMDTVEFESVGMAHLKIIFALLYGMLAVSFVVFLIERYGERLRTNLSNCRFWLWLNSEIGP